MVVGRSMVIVVTSLTDDLKVDQSVISSAANVFYWLEMEQLY